MARLSHRGEAGDGDGASMLAAAPAPAGAVANPLADAPLRRRVSVARTAGGGAEQLGAAKVELDEELLRELARTVSPRQHRRFLLAQIGLLGLLVLVLVGMAVGAVLKLGELTAALDELSQIQEGIAGMATDLNSMANNVKSLKKMEKSLNGLSGAIGGMTDDIGRLSNLGGQIGDALGSGAGSAITSLAQGGINTAVSALRGLITGDDAGGRGGDAGDPANTSQRLAASAFGPCDPNSTNATELVDCLNNATLAAPSPGATGNRGGGGGRNRDRNGGGGRNRDRNGGGGGFDWQGLLGSVLDGVGQVAGQVLSNAASGGGGGSGGGNPARPPGP